jgi:hypothetical protein
MKFLAIAICLALFLICSIYLWRQKEEDKFDKIIRLICGVLIKSNKNIVIYLDLLRDDHRKYVKSKKQIQKIVKKFIFSPPIAPQLVNDDNLNNVLVKDIGIRSNIKKDFFEIIIMPDKIPPLLLMRTELIIFNSLFLKSYLFENDKPKD